MDEIIGGREIVPLTAPVRHVTPPGWKSGTYVNNYSSLPYTVPSSDGDGTYYVRPMLSFECPSAGISPLSYPCDEFYGNRFTITFTEL